MTDIWDKDRRKPSRARIFTIRLPEAEIAGRVRKRTHRGLMVEMIRPYVGLTSFVGSTALADSQASEEQMVSAALLLLYKKALYFLQHRDEILTLYEQLLHKLSERSFEKTRSKIIARYENRKTRLERRFHENAISRTRYRETLGKLKKAMIQSLTRLYRAEHTLEEEILGGILKLNDISFFIDYFDMDSSETSPAAEEPNKQGDGEQNNKDKEKNPSHTGGDFNYSAKPE